VVLSAWSFLQSRGTAEEVVAIACRDGLLLAAKWCQQSVVVETDCSTVAAMMASRSGEDQHSSLLLRRPLKRVIGFLDGLLSIGEERVIM
jgi:hypothetical protein